MTLSLHCVLVPNVVTIHNETVTEGDKANITLRLSLPRNEDCNVTVQTVDETAVGKLGNIQVTCSRICDAYLVRK